MACAVNQLFGAFVFAAEQFAKFFKADALGFWHHKNDPQQLEHHHTGKEDKNGPGVVLENTNFSIEEGRGEQGDERGKYPMCARSPRLPVGTHLIGEYLGNEHPYHSALPHGMGSNKNQNEGKQQYRTCARIKAPAYHGQADDIADGTNIHQLLAPQFIDQGNAHEGEYQVDDPNGNGTKE